MNMPMPMPKPLPFTRFPGVACGMWHMAGIAANRTGATLGTMALPVLPGLA